MDEEQLKEITVAVIQQGIFDQESTSKETAIEIAIFINTLRDELNK